MTTVYVPTLTMQELVPLADDVRQLTAGWYRTTTHRWHSWDRNRNRVEHERAVETLELPLLDQLRAAASGDLPQHAAGNRPDRKTKMGPRIPPGWNESASSRLGEIYVGISGWHARLGQPRIFAVDEDWQKAVLRLMVGRAPELDQETGRELVADVRKWWLWCVVQAGFAGEDLLEQRRAG